MRKKAIILAFAMLLTLACIPAYADHGMPMEPSYTVAISIYGAKYYRDQADFQSGASSGSIPGGVKFYVWEDFDQGWLLGTDNANLGNSEQDQFVYISSSDVVSESESISPDVGQKTESEMKAVTTDELNLRCGPGTGFKVMKVLNNNTELTYDYTFQTDTTWMYVNAGGERGWVSGDYLRTTGSAQNVSEPPAQPDSGTAVTGNSAVQDPVKDKRGIVAGIILICVGIAVLIAAFVLYYMKKKKKEVENLKVR